MCARRGALESQMVLRLKQHFENLGLITAKELSLGYGRADLVVFNVNTSKCLNRFENGQLRSLDRIEYYSILRLLPENPHEPTISLEYLSEKLRFSTSYLRNELLSFLIRFGYVFEVEPCRYIKVNGFVPISDEIWAIEAKVSDWKKGAIQAKRYRVFANRVFLALQEKYHHRVDDELLKSHKIGLLTIGNEIKEEIPAPTLLPKDLDRFAFASEWLWRYKRRDIRKIISNAS